MQNAKVLASLIFIQPGYGYQPHGSPLRSIWGTFQQLPYRIRNTVELPVATTSPQRLVFPTTKRFQVTSLHLEPLVSDHLLQATATTLRAF